MDPLGIIRANGLIFQPGHYSQMLSWVEQVFPEEACGLLEGNDRSVAQVIPVENILHSPTRFSMDPQAQLRAFLKMEQSGTEMVGFFHSHPHGPIHPSPTDLAEFFYPGAVSVIWSHEGLDWQVHGYWIQDHEAKEVPLTCNGFPG